MADIIQFPKPPIDSHLTELLDEAALLLEAYSAEQIILALFEKATEAEDIAALMPSFSVIVDKN
jgi:hypothetical protein